MFLLLNTIHEYITETRDRTDIKSYSYESLLKDKAGFCRSFFREIGIGDEHVTAGLTALDRDSQKNSFLNKAAVAENKKLEISEAALEFVKRMAGEKFGIELAGEDYQVQNMPHQWDS